MNRNDITPELIRQLLSYDQNTGRFHWKKRHVSHFVSEADCKRWNNRHAGTEALTAYHKDGYLHGCILGFQFLAHRVAWAYHYNQTPPTQIDHISGKKDDNSIKNLRLADQSENMKNQKKYKGNTSGVVGVSFHKRSKKWTSYISVDGKLKHLGDFKEKLDAVSARRDAEKRYGYHSNHGRAA